MHTLQEPDLTSMSTPTDGLVYAGGPGVQLTWMDAKGRRLGSDAAHGKARGDQCSVDQRATNNGGIRKVARKTGRDV